MKKSRLMVPNIVCDDCKQTLEKAIGDIDGVQAVIVDLANKYAEVAYDEVDVSLERITDVIAEAGYTVTGVEAMTPGTWTWPV